MASIKELPQFLLLHAEEGDTKSARKLLGQIAEMIDASNCFDSYGDSKILINEYIVSALKEVSKNETADLNELFLLKRNVGKQKHKEDRNNKEEERLTFQEHYIVKGKSHYKKYKFDSDLDRNHFIFNQLQLMIHNGFTQERASYHFAEKFKSELDESTIRKIYRKIRDHEARFIKHPPEKGA